MIKRYSLRERIHDDGFYEAIKVGMYEVPDGEYVKFEEYKKLLDELEATKRQEGEV